MSEGLGVSIRRSVVTAVTAGLVAALSVGGCSDDEPKVHDSGLPPESELTESNGPSPTEPSPTDPSPTGPQEPPLPDAAKAPGKAGAKAFVAYYIRLLNYASHTGDGALLLRYGPSCRVCRSQADFAERLYGRGGWYRGGAWRPDNRTWLVLSSGSGYFVAVNVDTAAGRQLPRRDAEISRFAADRLRLNFLLKPSSRAWQVSRLVTPS
jgi:Family of unknown function (DUF6318)